MSKLLEPGAPGAPGAAGPVRASASHSWLRRRRLAEVAELYAPAVAGDRCGYCGGPGDCVDHVPGVKALCAMSDAERLAASPRIVRCCGYCNRLLRKCGSVDHAERVAFVRAARRARDAAAGAEPRRARPSRRATRARDESRPSGRGKSPGSRSCVLVVVGDWRICLGGFRNTYFVWRRASSRAPWVRGLGVQRRGELERQLWLADAPGELLAAVAELPEQASESSPAARRRAAAAAAVA